MPEVIFTGPAGRLEGRYHPAKQKNAPIAMVLHPHPQFHGTMNHQIIYQCYYAFAHRQTTPDHPFREVHLTARWSQHKAGRLPRITDARSHFHRPGRPP